MAHNAGVKRQRQYDFSPMGFAMMHTEELLSCLIALKVAVTYDDLVKPTPHAVQSIWIQLLDVLTGSTRDMIEAPKHTLLGMMEYKELYSDSLSLLILYRHCRDLAHICNVKPFSLLDLTRPEPQRLRTVLSGVMNFAKFVEDKGELLVSLKKDLEDTKVQVDVLTRRLDEIEADIGDIAAKNAEDEPKTKAQREENEKLLVELRQLSSELKDVTDEQEQLKQQRLAIVEDISSQKLDQTQLEQQTRDMKSRIVRSPERIKRHLSEMASQVAADRQTHAASVAKTRDLSKRLEVYSALETELRGLIELERDIETQRKLVADKSLERTTLRTTVENTQIELESHAERIKQLDRQLRNAEERTARQQKIIQEKQDEANARIDMLKAEYVERSKDRTVKNKLRERIVAEQRAVEAERDAFLEEHESELNELMGQYWALRKEAEDYMKTLSTQLGLEAYGFHL